MSSSADSEPEMSGMSGRARRDWKKVNDDFRYVHRRMISLKSRTKNIILTFNDLISTADAGRSFDQARSVEFLTGLGIFFVPFSFTSGLFSMNERYLSGGSQFGIYWAVALPLFLGAFLVAVMMRFWQDLLAYLKMKWVKHIDIVITDS